MPKWMMKFEVEAHLGVREDLKSLVFKHPALKYEIHFQNHIMSPGVETPLLFAYVVFDAENIDEAADAGAQHLRDFLDLLGFSTGVRYKIHRRIAVYDWTEGVSSRQGRMYTSLPHPNTPMLILDESFTPTLATFLEGADSEPLQRALRWFRVAVSADESDVKFQWFWFVIETLAGISTEKQEVPDRCCRCREPLHCPKCKEISRHRPYQAQAIEQLFESHVADDPDRAFRETSAFRHALLHGDDTSEVEKKQGTTLTNVVNIVGNVAWVALLSMLNRGTGTHHEVSELRMTKPSNFAHHILQASANVSIGLVKERELTIDDFPNPTFTFVVR